MTPDHDQNSLNSTWGKVKLGVCSAYIVIGLAVLSMSFNLMMEEVIEKVKWLMKKLGKSVIRFQRTKVSVTVAWTKRKVWFCFWFTLEVFR